MKPTIKKSSDPKGCGMPDTKKSAQKRLEHYVTRTALLWFGMRDFRSHAQGVSHKL